MNLDSDTKLSSLLSAIPSSTLIFDKLGIVVAGNQNKTLQHVCADAGIQFEEFLRAMDEIDWEKETPQHRDSDERPQSG